MKFLYLLIFLILVSFSPSSGQILEGVWVKVDAKMKDGSRIINRSGCGMNFMKYKFGLNGMVDQSEDVLFGDFNIPYRLIGDTLVIGGTLYNVVGITKDTLKLSFFVAGAEDAQLPVYYYTRTDHFNNPGKATFDPGVKDSVYQASNEFFPLCKNNYLDFMRAIPGQYDRGSIRASFIVDKKGKIKNYTVLQIDSVSKGFAKMAGNALGNLTWIPAKKNNLPVNTLVQVTIRTAQRAFGNRMLNTLKIEYPFLPQAPYDKLDPEEAEAEQKLFRQALNQLNSQNYEKAVELLNKCVEIDNIDLNAYYVRALAYTSLGKPKDACKDWSYLAGLGQVQAVQKLAKFCKN